MNSGKRLPRIQMPSRMLGDRAIVRREQEKWNRAGVGSRSERAWKSNQALVSSGVVERKRRAPTTAAAPSAATGTIRLDVEPDESPEPAPVSGNVETVESGQ